MHTKDKLADALMAVGLMDMSLQARGGYYHDFLSPLDAPVLQLLDDLHAAAVQNPANASAINALRSRVIDGDFDATTEESDAWAASDDGQATLAKLANESPGRRREHVQHRDADERLGDAPIESKYELEMQALAGFLDEQFNGKTKGNDRKVGFVMMVFEFGDEPGRCNYISNGVDRKDIVVLMKEMIQRFEGKPDPTPGHA